MAHSEKMTQTQSLFKGRIIEVKKDKVLLENGKETTREVVVHHGGVCIAAIDERITSCWSNSSAILMGRN